MENELLSYVLGTAGTLIVILLGIIAYFVRESIKEVKVFMIKNTEEHTALRERLAIGSEKLKQVDRNMIDIKELDNRIDKHDVKITDLEGKITGHYKKVV